MINRILLAGALACALSSHALADPACDAQFLEGRRPEMVQAQPGVRELCSDAFATLWSPATRDPVYSAEHLTAEGLIAGQAVKRVDAFHPDPRVPTASRATLRDYSGGRFDRGHMAPAHDMPTAKAGRESFSLANMVPQNKPLNRGAWAKIEETVRAQIVPRFRGEGWVVTGPIFDDESRRLKGRVAIPSRLFKAVYIPGDDFGNALVVGAWIVKNAAAPETRFVSLEALKAEIGIDPFPSLSAEMHAAAHPPAVTMK